MSQDVKPQATAGEGPVSGIEQFIRHVPRLVVARDVRPRVFGSGAVNRFNGAIAVAATHVLSNMWFFWFCVLLDLIMLPTVIQNPTPTLVVTYISQTVIQLLALPLLGAGQRIIAAAQDARAEADHVTLTALHTINVHQLEILRRLDKLEKRA
ncbi:MAG: hypothetical protein DLM67_11870 [Candidatus Nephthysia bennettiae]|uniref:DUF1003 domain-containing protein n=1 Tax=Candidatus Nephthysia bennettiae TaxID=3127016 RepID=A0A934KAF3_9BACT|nr:hypothetical protein [Candidatus Dormibacteraeota bacterium]MBJ7614259.1 hypothetical protein [Candidatus Dormibacteraeota bacterium]PZR94897.1 MAG: hypothetical protein DLM67_11870 [Candidatus Dormibacteraeota bacterium]